MDAGRSFPRYPEHATLYAGTRTSHPSFSIRSMLYTVCRNRNFYSPWYSEHATLYAGTRTSTLPRYPEHATLYAGIRTSTYSPSVSGSCYATLNARIRTSTLPRYLEHNTLYAGTRTSTLLRYPEHATLYAGTRTSQPSLSIRRKLHCMPELEPLNHPSVFGESYTVCRN